MGEDKGRQILTVHACKQDLTIEAAAGASGEVIITDPDGADPEVLVLPVLSACLQCVRARDGDSLRLCRNGTSVRGPGRVVRVLGRPLRGPGNLRGP